MRFTSRRTLLKGGTSGAILATTPKLTLSFMDQPPEIARKGALRQSACHWCYPHSSLDELCAYGGRIGLKGIDLLSPEEYEIPKKHGLICTMGTGAGKIPQALNRLENHARLEEEFRINIPLAAKAGVPNVITFSGNREGLPDAEGARNTVVGLNRVKKIAEDHQITICLELLNSKVNHKDYMADTSAWGIRVMQEVNSPNVKLLYDIYHMQIMEGDLIETIRNNIQWIGHFHTGGVPGRHELNDHQEVQWDGVMRAIVGTSFKGYVAHEFLPTADPFTSLLQAVNICDV